MLRRISLLILSMVLLASTAYASAVVDPLSGYTGSRTSLSGNVIGNGDWQTSFTIGWHVEQVSGTLYRYSYTLSGVSDSDNLSHWILQVSKDVTQPFGKVNYSGFTIETGDPTKYTDSGNPGIPNNTSIYGIKWNAPEPPVSSPWTFIFETNRSPVWGSFYAKDGDDTYAYNKYFGQDSSVNTDISGYIVTPNSAVPIPGAVWLLGSGLVGLVGLKRRFFA